MSFSYSRIHCLHKMQPTQIQRASARLTKYNALVWTLCLAGAKALITDVSAIGELALASWRERARSKAFVVSTGFWEWFWNDCVQNTVKAITNRPVFNSHISLALNYEAQS